MQAIPLLPPPSRPLLRHQSKQPNGVEQRPRPSESRAGFTKLYDMPNSFMPPIQQANQYDVQSGVPGNSIFDSRISASTASFNVPSILSPPRRSVYETSVEVGRYGGASSCRTKIRPHEPPPLPPTRHYVRSAQSSQSLVDLNDVVYQQYQRRNSTGRNIPIETSM